MPSGANGESKVRLGGGNMLTLGTAAMVLVGTISITWRVAEGNREIKDTRREQELLRQDLDYWIETWRLTAPENKIPPFPKRARAEAE